MRKEEEMVGVAKAEAAEMEMDTVVKAAVAQAEAVRTVTETAGMGAGTGAALAAERVLSMMVGTGRSPRGKLFVYLNFHSPQGQQARHKFVACHSASQPLRFGSHVRRPRSR